MHPAVSKRVVVLTAVVSFVAMGCPSPKTKLEDGGGSTTPSPDAGQPVREPPSWAGQTAERAWLREGFGEIRAIAPVDVDGDGAVELVVGARGVALLDANARAGDAPKWSKDWRRDPNNILSGGENEWVEALGMVDVNEDGVPDPIFTNSSRELYALNAKTGEELWYTKVDAPLYTARMALVDADADGVKDLFPSGGFSAYSGKTGQKLWTVDLPEPAIFLAAAQNFDGAGGSDLLITTELDGCVGTCPPPDPSVPPPANVHMVSGEGTVLYRATVPGTIVSAVAADLTGDGVDEAIVGTIEGVVHAIGAAGQVWELDLGEGFVGNLTAFDVDADQKAEVFASIYVPSNFAKGDIVAISPEGAEQWRYAIAGKAFTFAKMQLDDVDAPELVMGMGSPEGDSGGVIALNTEAGAANRLQWSINTGMPSDSLAEAVIDGARVVLIGSRDSQLRAVEPATGELAWRWAGGGFVFATAAGDLDGDGADEVVSGDDRGLLIASRGSDGTKLWAHKLDVGDVGQVTSVVVADLLPGGAEEVLAGGLRYFSDLPGVIELYGPTGNRVLSRKVDAAVVQLIAADLEGDGVREIISAERRRTGECTVHVLTMQGMTRWRTNVSSCEVPAIDVGDADGDGRLEIAYAEVTLTTPPYVAMLDASGAILWKHFPTEQGEDGPWARVVPGGMIYGGFAANSQGHVTMRALKDGNILWQKLSPPIVDPVSGDTLGGGRVTAAIVPDVDGDEVFELAVTTEACEATLISGRDGSALWSQRMENLDRAWNQRHFGGPVAYVSETDDVPGYLAIGLFAGSRAHSKALAFKLDGELLGSFEMEGESFAIAPMRFADGTNGAAVGSGLGVQAMRLVAP